jgi:hypothetical protein
VGGILSLVTFLGKRVRETSIEVQPPKNIYDVEDNPRICNSLMQLFWIFFLYIQSFLKLAENTGILHLCPSVYSNTSLYAGIRTLACLPALPTELRRSEVSTNTL